MFTKEDIQEILERSKDKILRIHYNYKGSQIMYITHPSNVCSGIVEIDNDKFIMMNQVELKERYLYSKFTYIFNSDKKKKTTHGEYILYSDIEYIIEV